MKEIKIWWFFSGFGLALVLAGVALFGLYQNTRADDAVPTPTTISQPAATPQPTGTSVTPVPVTLGLTWQRQNASGVCDTLRIDAQGNLYFGACQQGAIFAFLTQSELATYQGYVARYAPFDYAYQENGAQMRLVFGGSEGQAASAQEQAEIGRWAGGVYDRLATEKLRADMVARARVDLAQRLGISPDDIRTLSVEEAAWSDACLEVQRQGLFCAQVRTPGYRVILDVAGKQYEYHTDRRDLVQLAATSQPPATPAPTQTPLPTIPPTDAPPTPTAWPTPWPSPTAGPTATPWPTATPYPTPWPTPWPVTITDWRGEYYNNMSLSGAPVLVRNDKEVSFDWGNNSPGWPVPADHFSARWSRNVQFTEGKYNFRLEADDGARLWVAGNLLIDRWTGGHQVSTVNNQQIWNGTHQIIVEYFEQEGAAQVHLTWEKVEEPRTPTPVPTITGWRAEYYNNATLTGKPRIVRNEPEIAFDWKEGSPDRKINKDNFSARFTREIEFEPGVYRFYAVADDGVRVYVDDRLLIDGWQAGIRREYTGDIALEEGQHLVRIEYFERRGGAALSVRWEPLDGVLIGNGEGLAPTDKSQARPLAPILDRDD